MAEILINIEYKLIYSPTNSNLFFCGYNYNHLLGIDNRPETTYFKNITKHPYHIIQKKIVRNGYNIYALDSNNILHIWGYTGTYYYNLNMLSSSFYFIPRKFSDIQWKDFTQTQDYVLQIRNVDNKLFGCGENLSGQLGMQDVAIGDYIEVSQIGNTSWKSVYTYEHYGNFSFAIRLDDNILFGWGYNEENNLGLGYSSTIENSPIQIGTTQWKTIYSNYSETTFALANENNLLFGWGSNYYGELGIGNTIDSFIYTPIQIGLTSWKKIQVGWCFVLAIRESDNKLFGWGYNRNSELGIISNDYIYSPIQLGETSWKDIIQYANSTFAIKEDNNQVFTWGYNNRYNLGIGITQDIKIPIEHNILTKLLNNNCFGENIESQPRAWKTDTELSMFIIESQNNEYNPMIILINYVLDLGSNNTVLNLISPQANSIDISRTIINFAWELSPNIVNSIVYKVFLLKLPFQVMVKTCGDDWFYHPEDKYAKLLVYTTNTEYNYILNEEEKLDMLSRYYQVIIQEDYTNETVIISNEQSFITQCDDPEIIGSLYNIFPQNNQVNQQLENLQFEWSQINQVQYEFLLQKESENFIKIKDNLVTNNFTYNIKSFQLEPNTTYSWKIRQKNKCNYIESEPFTFKTTTDTIQLSPFLLKVPYNNTILNILETSELLFSWQNTDIDEDPEGLINTNVLDAGIQFNRMGTYYINSDNELYLFGFFPDNSMFDYPEGVSYDSTTKFINKIPYATNVKYANVGVFTCQYIDLDDKLYITGKNFNFSVVPLLIDTITGGTNGNILVLPSEELQPTMNNVRQQICYPNITLILDNNSNLFIIGIIDSNGVTLPNNIVNYTLFESNIFLFDLVNPIAINIKKIMQHRSQEGDTEIGLTNIYIITNNDKLYMLQDLINSNSELQSNIKDVTLNKDGLLYYLNMNNELYKIDGTKIQENVKSLGLNCYIDTDSIQHAITEITHGSILQSYPYAQSNIVFTNCKIQNISDHAVIVTNQNKLITYGCHNCGGLMCYPILNFHNNFSAYKNTFHGPLEEYNLYLKQPNNKIKHISEKGNGYWGFHYITNDNRLYGLGNNWASNSCAINPLFYENSNQTLKDHNLFRKIYFQENIKKVSTQYYGAFYLTYENKLYAIGANEFLCTGKCIIPGNCDTPRMNFIDQVQENVIDVDATSGYLNIISFITENNNLYMYGYNENYILSLSENTPVETIIELNLDEPYFINQKKSNIGWFYAQQIIDLDYNLYIVGANDCYICSLGVNMSKYVLDMSTQIQNNIIDVSIGNIHTQIIDSDYNLYIFGCNQNHQCNPFVSSSNLIIFDIDLPIQTNIKSVKCQMDYTQFLDINNCLYVFGDKWNTTPDNFFTPIAYDVIEYSTFSLYILFINSKQQLYILNTESCGNIFPQEILQEIGINLNQIDQNPLISENIEKIINKKYDIYLQKGNSQYEKIQENLEECEFTYKRV